ncbi:D-lactate dehydrogenase [Lachnospiraceae bacterium XBB2008]|nr:D-lactate dehydrogenase [Lachnospiraceae bacterium XBB2008]
MKLLLYAAKDYDIKYFTRVGEADFPEIQVDYIEPELDPRTATLSKGYDAICAFVSADVGAETLNVLAECGVKAVLMRCAGYNNVDVERAHELGIVVKRVPAYSPESIAEHAMTLAMSVNRHIHKAYNKVRENDFTLKGLRGHQMYGKTAGIVGTGKIGAGMCRICHGFGMKVIAYDIYENPALKDFVEYVSLDELYERSDLISLHCPLTDESYHMINIDSIKKMKNDVILINTSRGALVDTEQLIEGIRMGKFLGVGLDVYEEETGNVYEDKSDEIMMHSVTSRLLSFPNVIITSHQAFYTKEAVISIAQTTLQNMVDAMNGTATPNDC